MISLVGNAAFPPLCVCCRGGVAPSSTLWSDLCNHTKCPPPGFILRPKLGVLEEATGLPIPSAVCALRIWFLFPGPLLPLRSVHCQLGTSPRPPWEVHPHLGCFGLRLPLLPSLNLTPSTCYLSGFPYTFDLLLAPLTVF